jgi:site-specific recombinase XerD
MVSEALRYLGTVRNYAPATLDSDQASFDQFHQFLSAHRLPDDVRQFTGDNVQRFIASLAAKKQKASTIVVRLTALSSIAKTMMKLNDPRGRPYIAQDPTRTFEWPRPDAAETKFLLPAELAAFLQLPRPRRESIARDLLVDTGLRCSELCRANVGDVITISGQTSLAVTVKGRGRKVRKRHVPVSSGVASALYDYLLEREIQNPQDPKRRDEPLLLSTDGHRWRRTGLSGLMARIGLEAGIVRFRVSAHKLRHTANVVSRFARLEDGSPLDRWTRSQLLTHESARAIDRYEHLLPDELFEAREAQRQALSRYLGGAGTDGIPVASRPARAGDTLDPMASALLERLAAIEKAVAALGSSATGAVVEH